MLITSRKICCLQSYQTPTNSLLPDYPDLLYLSGFKLFQVKKPCEQKLFAPDYALHHLKNLNKSKTSIV